MNNMNPKVAWTILIVFLVIVLGAVGYFGYKYYQDLSKSSLTVTPATTTNTTDETASWKTYTNTKYKYSIKYPTDWTYREYSDNQTGAGFRPQSTSNDVQNEVINISENTRPASQASLSFANYVNIAAAQEIQNYDSLATIDKIVTQSGVTGYKTTWNVLAFGSTAAHVSFPITYFDTKDGSGDTIQVTGGRDNSQDYINIYNKMILTFQYAQ